MPEEAVSRQLSAISQKRQNKKQESPPAAFTALMIWN